MQVFRSFSPHLVKSFTISLTMLGDYTIKHYTTEQCFVCGIVCIENNIKIKYFCMSMDNKIGIICNTST